MPHTKQKIAAYIDQQARVDTLRFLTCGSVDDGKSTLIGRLLYEAQLLFDDQVEALRKASKKSGHQAGEMDFALLVDGLAAEQEQGITIDVAYRFFATNKRKFIVADTPGHEQYTRNMVTGASTAQLAILLVDARKGLLTQTKRHALIASLLGIRHIVLAVNKMDLVGYDPAMFHNISADFQNIVQHLHFASITCIPTAAIHGDNILNASIHTPWYTGPSLLGFLETLQVHQDTVAQPLRLPVQWVNRPHQDFRGFAGQITSGQLQVGDRIQVLPAGSTSRVKDILLFDTPWQRAIAGQSITVTLQDPIDISRGDVIVSAAAPCQVANHWEATLVWMGDPACVQGKDYLLQHGTQTVQATITRIAYRYELDTLSLQPAKALRNNQLGIVHLETDRVLPFEPYEKNRPMGAFILIDRATNATLAAGMIRSAPTQPTNLQRQSFSITKAHRIAHSGHRAKCIWLTGISGAGKSTIANALEKLLHQQGIRTYVLDGDNLRHGLNKDLGFTDPDRIENMRRTAEVAKLLVDAGLVTITALIAPFRQARDKARHLFQEGDFIEVFVHTPLHIAEERDPKGLYKKARQASLDHFTGITSSYEPPLKPEITIDTLTQQPEAAAQTIAAHYYSQGAT